MKLHIKSKHKLLSQFLSDWLYDYEIEKDRFGLYVIIRDKIDIVDFAIQLEERFPGVDVVYMAPFR
jgi:hypothetical protein